MTEQVLRELREAIVEGRIPQGEPLREVSLAATLGTGRSAVREAVRQLIQEGLVDYEPHRGAFVRVMSLGSTEPLVEVACKLDLAFSSSAAITETRPVRFLIVSSALALRFNAR